MNFALTPTLGGRNQWICGLGHSGSRRCSKEVEREYPLAALFVLWRRHWKSVSPIVQSCWRTSIPLVQKTPNGTTNSFLVSFDK